jgi:dipeptidyl aminopeptidase/acylaminoacyl peptidase
MKRPKNVFLSHIRILFLVCCLLLFFGVTVGDAKIVFRMDGDIYVSNDDGSGRRRLTNNTVLTDTHPRWSPDGKRIAFTRYMGNIPTSRELFIMNANGTHPQRLTHNNVYEGYPSWSPDGSRIAFASEQSGDPQVHVIELTTLAVTQLTENEKDEKVRGALAPDWSPDGTEIVYEKFIGSDPSQLAHKNIYVMSANGEQQRPLLPDPAEDIDIVIMRFEPRWSADGQSILFDAYTWAWDAPKTYRLTTMRIGRSPLVIEGIYDILGDNVLMVGACWMEKDRALLFGLILKDKPNANYDLYRYEPETRRLKRLTRDVHNEVYPDWIEGALSVSPHGKTKVMWGAVKQ